MAGQVVSSRLILHPVLSTIAMTGCFQRHLSISKHEMYYVLGLAEWQIQEITSWPAIDVALALSTFCQACES